MLQVGWLVGCLHTKPQLIVVKLTVNMKVSLRVMLIFPKMWGGCKQQYLPNHCAPQIYDNRRQRGPRRRSCRCCLLHNFTTEVECKNNKKTKIGGGAPVYAREREAAAAKASVAVA